MNWIPNGHQQITDLSSAVGLTVPAGSQFAIIRAEGQNVRWRDDATDPTASVGFPLNTGDALPFTYQGNLSAIKFIETTSGQRYDVAYYKV